MLFEEIEYDFGNVKSEKGRIEHFFKFKNTSNYDVMFTRCVASHGIAWCNYKDKLSYLEVDSVGYKMYLKGKRGRTKKKIRVQGYVDKCPKEYFETVLTIKGNIVNENK